MRTNSDRSRRAGASPSLVRRPPRSLVLLASPTLAVRRRWARALQGIYAIHQVTERPLLQQSMEALKPAVLVLDLALPRFGISVLPEIQRLSPSTKILLFTGKPDEREAILALKAGARGYYRTDIDPALLQKAVQMVQKGEIWVARKVIAHLLSELTTLTVQPQPESPARLNGSLAHLTPREREVAQLVGGGACNKEIACQLTITERTVKAHLTTIFRKLGLSDRLRLALYVSGHARGAA